MPATIAPTTTVRAATEQLEGIVKQIQAALEEAGDQARLIEELFEKTATPDLECFQAAIQTEIRGIREDITGEGGSDFDIERVVSDVESLVELIDLASRDAGTGEN